MTDPTAVLHTLHGRDVRRGTVLRCTEIPSHWDDAHPCRTGSFVADEYSADIDGFIMDDPKLKHDDDGWFLPRNLAAFADAPEERREETKPTERYRGGEAPQVGDVVANSWGTEVTVGRFKYGDCHDTLDVVGFEEAGKPDTWRRIPWCRLLSRAPSPPAKQPVAPPPRPANPYNKLAAFTAEVRKAFEAQGMRTRLPKDAADAKAVTVCCDVGRDFGDCVLVAECSFAGAVTKTFTVSAASLDLTRPPSGVLRVIEEWRSDAWDREIGGKERGR